MEPSISPRRARSCGLSILLFSTSIQSSALTRNFELDFASDVVAPQAFTLFSAESDEPPAAIASHSHYA